jgi:hypothetical protein
MCQGLAAFRVSAEGECLGPHLLALLAEAYGKVGQAAEGLGIVFEALSQLIKRERVLMKRSCIG